MELSIGLVCEGKTDFLIITECISASLQGAGHSVQFTALQPTKDRTSGAFGEGGWIEVFRWCVRNEPKARARFFGSGLFDDPEAVKLDILMVHSDGDLMEILAIDDRWKSVRSPDPAAFGGTGSDRLNFTVQLIEAWIDAKGDDTEYATRTLPAATIREAEAWLLASGGTQNADDVEDPKKSFAIMWNNWKGRHPDPAMQRLSKPFSQISEYVNSVKADHDKLASNSVSYKHLYDIVSSHIS